MARQTAVLLPLRLETVLVPKSGGKTTLLLLVAPDVPWFDRHDPRVTKEELDDVQACWKASAGQLTLEAFGELARVHGGPRATWLVRKFPSGFNRQAARLRPRDAKPRFPHIPAFPTHLEVWIGRGGAAPVRKARQPVKQPRLVLDPTLPRGKRWWSNWKEAKEVGLGFEIDLGSGDPDDIDVIYAVGINPNVGPKPLFTAHAAAGRLAIVPLGAPTNAVAHAPAIDLQGSVEEWFKLATTGGDGGLATYLGMPNAALSPIRGFDLPQNTDGFLVAALWSALWGRVGEDVWQLGPGVREVGRWAQRSLKPEGPLPAIRIDDQPYGLLPVTALEDWQPAQGDPVAERFLHHSLVRLRERLARAAEKRGTVRGADPRRFLGLVGDTPVSGAYSVRWFLPLELLAILETVYGTPVDPQLLDAWWERVTSVPLGFAPHPARRYATVGRAQDLGIPLVEPLRFPKRGSVPLERLLETLVNAAHDSPELLLFPARLFHEFEELADGIGGDELDAPDSLLIRLLLHSFLVAAARANEQNAGPLLDPPFMDTSDETVLAQALSSGDPWATQGQARDVFVTTVNATMRVAEQAQAYGSEPIERAFRAVLDTASHRVDPWITSMAWRRLRTLQTGGEQASALGAYGWVDGPLIGRDGPTEGGLLHAPSDLQARTAVVLRDKAISDPEDKWKLTLRSDTVRAARQLAEEVRMGAHPTEAVGRMIERAVGKRTRIAVVRDHFPAAGDEYRRRTCDGLAVIAPEADLSFLTAAERTAVENLRSILDAYADLLVADAVHKVVGGRMDLARPAMEAAAGMSTPPELDVLRTPRQGRSATTSVRVVLPVPGGAAGARPAKIADPAVAAFIDAAAGGQGLWTWELQGGSTSRVRLADVGLAPADTLALSADALDRLAIAAAGSGSVTKRPDGPQRAQRLAALLAGSPETAQADVVNLRRRLANVTTAATTLRDRLRAPGASRQLLVRAARFGIAPAPLDDEALGSVLGRAADELDERLGRLPKGADLTAQQLVDAISDLVSAGRLPVLAHVASATLPVSRAVGKPAASRWLEVVAAVRPRLRALDSHQLGPGSAAFAVRSNRSDLWQTTPSRAELQANASRLELAFGPAGAFGGGRVAVSLVDRFVELVPTENHATTAAFGFNAPAARAPQAILLAVPPVVGRPLDTATLVRIVEETRRLARARMARPEDLDELAAALPSSLFPVARRGGVNLSTGAESWP